MFVAKEIIKLCRLLHQNNSEFNKDLLPMIYEHRLAFRVESDLNDYRAWKSALILQNQAFLRQFSHCQEMFKKHNIDAISFKGPLLSQELYGKPDLRQFGDLDFFIPKHQISKSIRILEELGFVIRGYSKKFDNKFLFKFSNVIVLKHLENDLELELHWQPFSKVNGMANQIIGDVFSESRNLKMYGKEYKTMQVEQNLKYLLLHGHKHQWFRLGWLYDFHLLVGKMQSKDHDALFLKTELHYIYEAAIGLAELLFHNRNPKDLSTKARKLLENYLDIINTQSFPPKVKGRNYTVWKYTPYSGVFTNCKNICNVFYFPSNADYISYLNFASAYAMLKPFRYLWRFLTKS